MARGNGPITRSSPLGMVTVRSATARPSLVPGVTMVTVNDPPLPLVMQHG